jgi:hypothetical protein
MSWAELMGHRNDDVIEYIIGAIIIPNQNH